ncbi:hypothetical protein [Haloarcula terrestris]|uniref:hypothetical protein n=1 Tax=Haloarcula terrestris TaxID=2950533 RepID=UPI00287BA4A3|nr:hypothetical protein [Haloarcula terrestris]
MADGEHDGYDRDASDDCAAGFATPNCRMGVGMHSFSQTSWLSSSNGTIATVAPGILGDCRNAVHHILVVTSAWAGPAVVPSDPAKRPCANHVSVVVRTVWQALDGIAELGSTDWVMDLPIYVVILAGISPMTTPRFRIQN